MPSSKRSPNSGSIVQQEFIFRRGSNICRTGCLLAQLFGICLLLISTGKFFYGDTNSISEEWKLFLIGIYLLITGYLLKHSNKFNNLFSVKSNSFSRKRALALISILICSIIIISYIRLTSEGVDTYKGYFFGEGGLVEWTQVLVLLLSTRLAGLIANDLKIKDLSSRINLAYIFISGLLLFIILEELAWGQVIFSWQSPSLFVNMNAQRETTLHNLVFFQNILDKSFLLISLLIFILICLVPYFISKAQRNWTSKNNFSLGIFLPPTYSWPLFAGNLFIAFFVANPSISNMIINRDQEWAELLLYIGIFISLLRTYVLLGDSTPRNKNIFPA